ncbi:hypothetical protein B0T24DRAFT_33529 [Lasiosphaeria ovina]|uniref:Uncharacterized protein n=1 Tax=Lasiosphaeria ovina TaxID=92902 RepID=A0AAE0NKF2_9PEZI|nr:hypothetical protein B0T24DRAFT_33529 [Lasiosphaeria ovina]
MRVRRKGSRAFVPALPAMEVACLAPPSSRPMSGLVRRGRAGQSVVQGRRAMELCTHMSQLGGCFSPTVQPVQFLSLPSRLHREDGGFQVAVTPSLQGGRFLFFFRPQLEPGRFHQAGCPIRPFEVSLAFPSIQISRSLADLTPRAISCCTPSAPTRRASNKFCGSLLTLRDTSRPCLPACLSAYLPA